MCALWRALHLLLNKAPVRAPQLTGIADAFTRFPVAPRMLGAMLNLSVTSGVMHNVYY